MQDGRGMLGPSCHLGQDTTSPVSQLKDSNTRTELLLLTQAFPYGNGNGVIVYKVSWYAFVTDHTHGIPIYGERASHLGQKRNQKQGKDPDPTRDVLAVKRGNNSLLQRA